MRAVQDSSERIGDVSAAGALCHRRDEPPTAYRAAQADKGAKERGLVGFSREVPRHLPRPSVCDGCQVDLRWSFHQSSSSAAPVVDARTGYVWKDAGVEL